MSRLTFRHLVGEVLLQPPHPVAPRPERQHILALVAERFASRGTGAAAAPPGSPAPAVLRWQHPVALRLHDRCRGFFFSRLFSS